ISIRIGKMRDSSLIMRKLADSPRILCASPAYLQEHAAPQQPEDLMAHNCLTYRHGAVPPTWRFMRDEKLTEVRVEGTLHADHAEVVRQGALAGLGIALLPDWLIGQDIEEGRLLPLLTRHSASPVGF